MSHVGTTIRWTAIAVAGIFAALLLTACTSSHQILTFFFDGVPPLGEDLQWRPVQKPPRRPPYVRPEALTKIVEIEERPPPIDWQSRYQALARTAGGDVDWARALADKVITPRPGIAPDAKDEDPTDMDLEFVPKDQPEYKVVFPHKTHTQWMVCANCHTGIFEMEKGKAEMTMDKLNTGAYCGVCHGKVASPEMASCPACHKAMPT